MKITVKSPAAFKQQLLDAGVPPAQIKAALAHAEKKGPLKGGQTVTIPDTFKREDGGKATRKTLGDTDKKGTAATAKGGKAMGTLGIHAFNDVENKPARRATVDACGYPLNPYAYQDSCGGGGGAGRAHNDAPRRPKTETPKPAPAPARRPTVDACGYPLNPSGFVDACGGQPIRRRRTTTGGGC